MIRIIHKLMASPALPPATTTPTTSLCIAAANCPTISTAVYNFTTGRLIIFHNNKYYCICNRPLHSDSSTFCTSHTRSSQPHQFTELYNHPSTIKIFDWTIASQLSPRIASDLAKLTTINLRETFVRFRIHSSISQTLANIAQIEYPLPRTTYSHRSRHSSSPTPSLLHSDQGSLLTPPSSQKSVSSVSSIGSDQLPTVTPGRRSEAPRINVPIGSISSEHKTIEVYQQHSLSPAPGTSHPQSNRSTKQHFRIPLRDPAMSPASTRPTTRPPGCAASATSPAAAAAATPAADSSTTTDSIEYTQYELDNPDEPNDDDLVTAMCDEDETTTTTPASASAAGHGSDNDDALTDGTGIPVPPAQLVHSTDNQKLIVLTETLFVCVAISDYAEITNTEVIGRLMNVVDVRAPVYYRDTHWCVRSFNKIPYRGKEFYYCILSGFILQRTSDLSCELIGRITDAERRQYNYQSFGVVTSPEV